VLFARVPPGWFFFLRPQTAFISRLAASLHLFSQYKGQSPLFCLSCYFFFFLMSFSLPFFTLLLSNMYHFSSSVRCLTYLPVRQSPTFFPSPRTCCRLSLKSPSWFFHRSSVHHFWCASFFGIQLQFNFSTPNLWAVSLPLLCSPLALAPFSGVLACTLDSSLWIEDPPPRFTKVNELLLRPLVF